MERLDLLLSSYLTTRRRRFRSRTQLERWQSRRLRVALRRAHQRFSFYRELEPPASREVAAMLADYPIIDKARWLDEFAGMNVAGISLAEARAAGQAGESDRSFSGRVGDLSVGLSSGTSGRQGVFLTSTAERATWAGTMLARALPDGLLSPARVAMVLRAGGPLYDSVQGGRIQFRYIDLSWPVERQLAELVAFNPTVLAAPPPALQLYAAEAARLRPTTIYSIADVLDPEVAARVCASFGVPVGQIYQATEGFLGISCRAGRVHLNEDLLVFEREVIDQASGRFVPIITDLFRTSQAIIRYRMGDVLMPAVGECACGSALAGIERIEGRADDLLWLPDLAGHRQPLFADFIRGAVLGTPGVADFQCVQLEPARLSLGVQLQSDPPGAQEREHVWQAAAQALHQLLVARGLAPVTIVEADFEELPLTSKRRRVRTQVAADAK